MPEITIAARIDCLDDVLDFIGDAMQRADIAEGHRDNINICVEEIFVNIAHYAYPEDAKGHVSLRIRTDADLITIEISDGGMPYDPLSRPDPDTGLSAEERQIGGLGIYMVKKLMDHVAYRHEDGKNILTMQKNI